MSMLRPIFSVAGRNGQTASAVAATTARRSAAAAASRSFGTQSGDDAEPPTAMAKLHLEDGTTLTAKSFGCHSSVEGEVSKTKNELMLLSVFLPCMLMISKKCPYLNEKISSKIIHLLKVLKQFSGFAFGVSWISLLIGTIAIFCSLALICFYFMTILINRWCSPRAWLDTPRA
jgi:hypothetical protein